MAEGNIITAIFAEGETKTAVSGLWQWDYGQVLQVEGLTDLPENTEFHFAQNGESVTAIGTTTDDVCTVSIPDSMLQGTSRITAYIYLHSGDDDGETEYEIRLPIKSRTQPETYDEDDPEIQAEYTALVQATELLNADISGIAQDVADAQAAAEDAQDAAQDAQDALAAAQALLTRPLYPSNGQ